MDFVIVIRSFDNSSTTLKMNFCACYVVCSCTLIQGNLNTNSTCVLFVPHIRIELFCKASGIRSSLPPHTHADPTPPPPPTHTQIQLLTYPHTHTHTHTHRDLIMECLDDRDESIRLRALDLISGMVSKKNLMDIVKKLILHMDLSESASTSAVVCLFVCLFTVCSRSISHN